MNKLNHSEKQKRKRAAMASTGTTRRKSRARSRQAGGCWYKPSAFHGGGRKNTTVSKRTKESLEEGEASDEVGGHVRAPKICCMEALSWKLFSKFWLLCARYGAWLIFFNSSISLEGRYNFHVVQINNLRLRESKKSPVTHLDRGWDEIGTQV